MQTRLVRCIMEGIVSTNCLEIGKPIVEQQCNVEPCKEKVIAHKPPKSKKIHYHIIKIFSYLFYKTN